MNLVTAFAAATQQQGDKTAVFWDQSEYSYRHLYNQARWVGGQLQSRFGVQPADRVGIWLKNCPEFIPSLFGVLHAGAVAVPINNFLKADEVTFILRDAGIDVLITDASLLKAQPALTTAVPHLKVMQIESFESPPSDETVGSPLSERRETDLAVIIYTSGTTGHPKGAMLTHGNLLHNVESCRQVLSAVDHDRFVLLLPMFHSFMLCVCVLLPLIVGGSIVLVKSLHPPKNVVQEIIARQATILPGIPQLFRSLAQSQMPEGMKLPIRLSISGAAPLPGQILKEFTERLGIPLLEGYGLSEASPVVAMNPIQGPWKAGSIGVPIPNVEVTIQDDQGNVLSPGEIGELSVRGGNVMQGYWNQPGETAKVLRNGWLLTGDIGYQDDEGYFYITDRKKDMLLVNGINVYPREIEEVLYRFPGVKDVAVVSQTDARKGEQPVAYIAAAENAKLDEGEIIAYLRQKLADYKVPRRIYYLADLPRNATGKVLKTQLREMAQRNAAGDPDQK